MTWIASPDGVPDWHVQVTIYDDDTGGRVATVFDKRAVSVIRSAPEVLAALRDILAASTPSEAADAIAAARRTMIEAEEEN